MEDSCPATPLVLVERNSKSPLQISISSPESDGMKSPDSRCVICLGKLQNKSFTDSCLHQFCFQCLLQWSKVKPECPLCKQPFKSIIHNVRSNMDYDQYHIEHGEPHYVLSDLMHSYNFDLIPVDRRFRYRSTMTREYFTELAESFLAHTRRIPEETFQIPPMMPVNLNPTNARRHSSRLNSSSYNRTRQRGTSDFRRNIYSQDLWVQDLADISGRYRECTPQFYRDNPAQLHRIIPWLNREVNVLLSNCDSHAYILSRIISSLTQYSIRSRAFRELVQPYFGDRTDHFIHEFYTFARSVYDIAGFDQHAVYGTNPYYATEVQEVLSSSDNSDDIIEILETVLEGAKKLEKTDRSGFKKSLLKRANDDKVQEPMPGPSGVGSGAFLEPIEICESEDEVKILDYVKPEPEVVTLSSGEETITLPSIDLQHRKTQKLSSLSDESSEFEKKIYNAKSVKGKCRANGFGLKGRQKRKYIKLKQKKGSRCESLNDSRYEKKYKMSNPNSKSRSKSGSNGHRSRSRSRSKSSSSRSRSDSHSSKSKSSSSRSSNKKSSRSSKSESPPSSVSRSGSGSSRSLSSDSSRSSTDGHKSRSRSSTASSKSHKSGASFYSSTSSERKPLKKRKKKKSKTYVKDHKKRRKHKHKDKREKPSENEKRKKKKVKSYVTIPSSQAKDTSFGQSKFLPNYWSILPNPAASSHYNREDNTTERKSRTIYREKRLPKHTEDSSSDWFSDEERYFNKKYCKSRNVDSGFNSSSTRALHNHNSNLLSAQDSLSSKFNSTSSVNSTN